MKFGAQNQLKGKVVSIKTGQVMCEVKVKIKAGADMCSVMTVDSLNALGLKKGDPVVVLAKAVNVLLATE
jgi:molybdopterin-binding protein